MPDPVVIVKAMTTAFVVAIAVTGLAGWLRSIVGPAAFDAGWVLGIALGFLSGCWILGIQLDWPLRDDQGRFLAVVVPAAAIVELLAAFPKVPRAIVWPLRLAIVAGGARVLLDGTSFIADVSGPGTSEWSPPLAWLIFAGLGTLEAFLWINLSFLSRRVPDASVPCCLAIVTAAAAVTVMLSGYASGGQMGLPLAAALMGACASMFLLTKLACATGPPGLPVVGLMSLLVIGRFFGELTTTQAILLSSSPLLAWVPEFSYARRLPAWAAGLARVTLVGAAVSAVLLSAQAKFNKDFSSPAQPLSVEPSADDYMNFGR